MNSYLNKSIGILSLITLLSTGMINTASDIFSQKREFIALENNMKKDWLNYIKQMHDDKFNLMIKEHEQRAKILTSLIDAKQKDKNINFQSLEQHMKTALTKMIEFAEAKMDDWKKLCDAERAKGETIYLNHKRLLNDFKNKSGIGMTSKEVMEPNIQPLDLIPVVE